MRRVSKLAGAKMCSILAVVLPVDVIIYILRSACLGSIFRDRCPDHQFDGKRPVHVEHAWLAVRRKYGDSVCDIIEESEPLKAG